ncbi:MAG TPA: hypothetical protein VN915_06135 [Elusimicrobiota bacterium]|nr:hypothetical protein [Elusimicrobiota bacterium]
METTLDSAPSGRFSWPRARVRPFFFGLTALFSLADAGSRGVLATTALAAVKAALVMYFLPELAA